MSEPAAAAPDAPAVLGHRIVGVPGSDRFRLVDADGTRTLCEGTHAECREALAARLEQIYGRGHPNVVFPTLGGLQLWGDVHWYAGWRIQRNVVTGHHRLLDPDRSRHGWGSLEACRARLEAVRRDRGLRLPSEHLVLLLHGMGRTAASLRRMAAALASAGYAPASIDYPSTRRSIAELAAQLDELVESLEDVRTISFVTHSLGGMVVRRALADAAERPAGWRRRIEVGRLAMLAPPSRGAAIATALREYLPIRMVLAPMRELTLAEAGRVPLPDCRFGIVAAARGDGRGWNPLVPGDDDGLVGVDEAKLPGAEDFLVVRGFHTFVMDDPEVIAAVLRYLSTGRFAAAAGS